MLLFWSIAIITTIALHWLFKFGKTGQTIKALCIAVPYTILTFKILGVSKLLFIPMFFYVTISMWCIVIVSMSISKQWAMDPKEEPYHS